MVCAVFFVHNNCFIVVYLNQVTHLKLKPKYNECRTQIRRGRIAQSDPTYTGGD